MCRDRRGPAIAAQVLIYPALDPRCESESYREFGDGYLLDAASVRQAWRWYLNGADAEPYAAPALAYVGGLPPSLVITAEYDVLRDEERLYAARLEASGVPAHVERFEGNVHGLWAYGRVLTTAAVADQAIVRFLARHHC